MENRLNISELFMQFAGMKVLVIGDVMIDSYLFGKVDRISPEAPVPIVSVTRKEDRPGGAANVAINVNALGAIPFLCSVIGSDEKGKLFLDLMENLKLPIDGLVSSDQRITTVKTRVIGNNHQLLRVDEEQDETISEPDTERLIKTIAGLLEKDKMDVIIIEDYDKGVLHENLIKKLITLASVHKVPVAVDPKRRNFSYYRGVSLFKPNLHELKSGLKVDFEKPDLVNLDQSAGKYRRENHISRMMVTLSEAGVYAADEEGSTIIPAHLRNISDVSGAGDTVISVASLCLAAGVSTYDMALLANLAGGLVCEKVGVIPVDKDQFMEEALLLTVR